jgi:hypothetical protein
MSDEEDDIPGDVGVEEVFLKGLKLNATPEPIQEICHQASDTLQRRQG